jgi:hypothetical protein
VAEDTESSSQTPAADARYAASFLGGYSTIEHMA